MFDRAILKRLNAKLVLKYTNAKAAFAAGCVAYEKFWRNASAVRYMKTRIAKCNNDKRGLKEARRYLYVETIMKATRLDFLRMDVKGVRGDIEEAIERRQQRQLQRCA